MQRRIEEADGDRKPLHFPEEADEIAFLHGQNLGQGALAPFEIVGEDHLAHRHDAVGIEEHMLGAAEADALGAELASDLGILRGVGVGADLELAVLVDPLHELTEVAGQFGLHRRYLAEDDFTGGTIKGDDVALFDNNAALGGELLLAIVDDDVAATGDAAFAHAASDDRRVGGHAAASGENPLGGMHAVDVLGAGLDPHENDLETDLGGFLGFVGGEDHLAAGGAGGSGQALGDDRLGRFGIEGGMQQLVELGGLDPQHPFLVVDQPVLDHVDGNLYRRVGGAFAVTGLQHVELALFDGELDILHILVMLLKDVADLCQLGIAVGEHIFHRRQVAGLMLGLVDRLRGADAGDDVLALGVDQVLAVEVVLAGGGVAGEGDAGGAVVAHVAVDHGLNIDGGTPLGGDIVELAVGDGAGVHPRAEDRADGAPELLLGILGEIATKFFLDLLLELHDQILEIVGGQFGIELHAAGFFFLLKEMFEDVAVHFHDDVRIHLDEAAVGVVGEAGIAALLDDPLHGLVVEAEVEDGVHHAGHGGASAGAHRHQQRVLAIAELLAHQGLDLLELLLDLPLELRRVLPVVLVELGADLGGDGESRRDRQADGGHFRQVGTLAAQQVFHVALALGFPVAEKVHILHSHQPSPPEKFLAPGPAPAK